MANNTITRLEIGEILKKEYGEDNDKYIDYFFFQIQVSHLEKYNKDVNYHRVVNGKMTTFFGRNDWRLVKYMEVEAHEKFTFLYFVKFIKEGTERHREKSLDDSRKDIRATLRAQNEVTTAEIIVSRVCKYTELDIL